MVDEFKAPTKKEWLSRYDLAWPKFVWFVRFYFGKKVEENMIMNRIDQDVAKLLNNMNQIWFELPDHKFNIIEDPPGWSMFLALIENIPMTK